MKIHKPAQAFLGAEGQGLIRPYRAGGLGRGMREPRETLNPQPSGWGQSQMFFLRELQNAKPQNLMQSC
jgi:hypothetical protein